MPGSVLTAEPRTTADFARGVAATVRHGEYYTGITARIDHARQRDDLDLQQAVVAAYRMIQTALAHAPDGPRTPQRFWNFVPGIVNATGGGLDRYMVFNAGRFAAFADWFRDPARATAPHARAESSTVTNSTAAYPPPPAWVTPATT